MGQRRQRSTLSAVPDCKHGTAQTLRLVGTAPILSSVSWCQLSAGQLELVKSSRTLSKKAQQSQGWRPSLA